MRWLLTSFFVLHAGLLAAETVVPKQTIRAREIIQPEHLQYAAIDPKGALTDPADIIGKEARVALYPDRRIFARDLAPAALIDRNQVVSLVFVKGGLRIEMEGRALERGAVGAAIRVLNPASRMTVTGRILENGKVEVY